MTAAEKDKWRKDRSNARMLLDWRMRFKDGSLQEEFSEYCRYQKLAYFLIIIGIPFMLVFVTFNLITLWYDTTWKEFFYSLLGVILWFFVGSTAWLIGYSQLAEKSWLESHITLLQTIFIISTTLLGILYPAVNLIINDCDKYPEPIHPFLVGWHCNRFEVMPMDTLPFYVVNPILNILALNEARTDFIIASLLLCNGAYFSYSLYLHDAHNAVIIIGWSIFICAIVLDLHILRVCGFLNHKNLEATLVENERLAEEVRTNELRHMIGNVAHDLKTPLSSFMSGVEFMTHALQDLDDRVTASLLDRSSIQQIIHSLRQCVYGVRNTNAFMLMTINRCIDYTKASKGLKLTPKNETIHLLEVLQLPLDCMRNIQQRMSIVLEPLASEICSHIITDKQWLQENLLCLLSNAVKYSSAGHVSISVHLCKVEEFGGMPAQCASAKESHERSRAISLYSASSKEVLSPQHTHAADEDLMHRKQSIDKDSELLENSVTLSVKGKRFAGSPSSSSARLPFLPSQGSSRKVQPVDRSDSEVSLSTVRSNLQWGLGFAQSNKTSGRDSVALSYLRFDVEDTGIGMSEEEMESLFNPFRQAQRLAGGTGLGLYSLAKRVEALNGFYGVKKRRDGAQGSLFWFAVPYKPDSVSAAMLLPHNNALVGCTSHEVLSMAPDARHSFFSSPSLLGSALAEPDILLTDTPAAPAVGSSNASPSDLVTGLSQANQVDSVSARDLKVPPPIDTGAVAFVPGTATVSPSHLLFTEQEILPPPAKAAMRVDLTEAAPSQPPSPVNLLLVDDAPSILKMVSMMLHRHGHRIATAENGAQALQCFVDQWQLQQCGYDVILMDLQMPVMDGLEATRRVRRWEEEQGVTKRQVIVGMSANSDFETRQEALAAGMNDFMEKPFSVHSFHEILRHHLSHSPTISAVVN